jgi:hypothetical protein
MKNVILKTFALAFLCSFLSISVNGQNTKDVEKNDAVLGAYQNYLQQRSINISDLNVEAYSKVLKHSELILLPYFQARQPRGKVHVSDDFYISIDVDLAIISIYDIKNQQTKNIYLKEIFPEINTNTHYDAVPEVGLVYVALRKEHSTEVVRIDAKGVHTSLGSVDYTVTALFSIEEGSKFILYAPYAVWADKESIIVADSELNEIKRFEKLPDFLKPCSSVDFYNIKYANNKLYFNPVLTDEIFEMDLDGNKKLIFAGFYQKDGGIKTIEELEKLTYFTDAPWAYQPFMDFEVTDRYIYLTHTPYGKKNYTVYERATGKSVHYARAFIKEPPADEFKLIFDFICGANDDMLYSIHSGRDFKSWQNSTVKKNPNNEIHKTLMMSAATDSPFIHQYSFDFAELYSNATQMNVPEAEFEMNKNH